MNNSKAQTDEENSILETMRHLTETALPGDTLPDGFSFEQVGGHWCIYHMQSGFCVYQNGGVRARLRRQK